MADGDLYGSPNVLSIRALFQGAAFALLIGLGVVLSRPVENFVRDLMMASISPWTDPGDRIVLVTVTEDTLSQFAYRSPIDRGFLAGLVTAIAGAGPKAIGIDILFDQPTEAEKDAALRSALAEAGVPVVVASAGADDGLQTRQTEFLEEFSQGVRTGLATMARDGFDGVVREHFAGRDRDGEWHPGFAQAIAAAAGFESSRERRDMIFYRGENAAPHAFPAYPAHTAELLPPAWFAGKFVLIGVDLPLDDRHPTPFVATEGVKGGMLPGVAIHAHGLAQILRGETMDRPAPALVWAIALGMGLAAGWLSWRPWPVLAKPLMLVGLLAAAWAAVIISFSRFGYYVPLVGPSVITVGVSALSAFLAWQRDSEQRQFIRQAFSRYVSPAVVDSILADPSSLRLGGARRRITCVFTDMEGFTSFSESQPPERVASVLNAYLDRISTLFVDRGATIDKLVGDSVVGFFGAPVDQPDQCERAIGLALAIDDLTEDFRRETAAAGISLGVTRVGIHCGPAIVGNFGGTRFFDYTAIGDTVNTAARLEGANKHIGTRLLVSGTVAAFAGGHLLRPAGFVFLKGKSGGIEVYEPLKPGAVERTYLDEFCEAYRLLTAGSPAAARTFERLAQLFPGDRLVAYHLARLARGQTGADIRLSEK